MSAQASVLTSEFRRDAISSGPSPQGEQSRECPQGTGCATGRGQGGDITLSFLVTWALVRTHFFLDKSELSVGSVEMRTKQETGGAGNETGVGLHESLGPLRFPHQELGSCSFGPRWATNLQATPEDRAEAKFSGMLPKEIWVLQ